MPMKFATVACSALAGLVLCWGAGALTSPAEAQGPSSAPASYPPQPAAPPKAGAAPAVQEQAAPIPSAGRKGPQAKPGDRRRRTYASCNRLSHARGLRGGARRRFLIRCKLGYERPKAGQNQGQQAPQGRQP